jgi:hypothetical protein
MAEETGFTIDFSDFEKKFTQIVKSAIPSAGARGLQKSAAFLLRDAILETPTVPKITGNLRRTQQINKPTLIPNIAIEAGFAAEYAAKVHEMPDTNNFTEPGSGPKYLEKKLIQHKEKYMKKVADHILSEAK